MNYKLQLEQNSDFLENAQNIRNLFLKNNTKTDLILLNGSQQSGKTSTIIQLIGCINSLGYSSTVVSKMSKEEFLERHEEMQYWSFEVIQTEEDNVFESFKKFAKNIMGVPTGLISNSTIFIVDDFDKIVDEENYEQVIKNILSIKQNIGGYCIFTSTKDIDIPEEIDEDLRFNHEIKEFEQYVEKEKVEE